MENELLAQHHWDRFRLSSGVNPVYVARETRSAETMRMLLADRTHRRAVFRALALNEEATGDVLAELFEAVPPAADAALHAQLLWNRRCPEDVAAAVVNARQPGDLKLLSLAYLPEAVRDRLLAQGELEFVGGALTSDAAALAGYDVSWPGAPVWSWLQRRDNHTARRLSPAQVLVLRGRGDLSDDEWVRFAFAVALHGAVCAEGWFACTPHRPAAAVEFAGRLADLLVNPVTDWARPQMVVGLFNGESPQTQRDMLAKLLTVAHHHRGRMVFDALLVDTDIGTIATDLMPDRLTGGDVAARSLRDLVARRFVPGPLRGLSEGQLEVLSSFGPRWTGTLGALVDFAMTVA